MKRLRFLWLRRLSDRVRRPSSREIERRMAVVREAVKHEFPIGDIETVLAEIERGYECGNRLDARD